MHTTVLTCLAPVADFDHLNLFDFFHDDFFLDHVVIPAPAAVRLRIRCRPHDEDGWLIGPCATTATGPHSWCLFIASPNMTDRITANTIQSAQTSKISIPTM